MPGTSSSPIRVMGGSTIVRPARAVPTLSSNSLVGRNAKVHPVDSRRLQRLEVGDVLSGDGGSTRPDQRSVGGEGFSIADQVNQNVDSVRVGLADRFSYGHLRAYDRFGHPV